jgi:hypothetical protein
LTQKYPKAKNYKRRFCSNALMLHHKIPGIKNKVKKAKVVEVVLTKGEG